MGKHFRNCKVPGQTTHDCFNLWLPGSAWSPSLALHPHIPTPPSSVLSPAFPGPSPLGLDLCLHSYRGCRLGGLSNAL